MAEYAKQLLSLIEIPILLVHGDRVSFANEAAKRELLPRILPLSAKTVP